LIYDIWHILQPEKPGAQCCEHGAHHVEPDE
jgi:hypothetical protein